MKDNVKMIFADLGGEYAAVPAEESTNERKNILLLNETGKDLVEGIQSSIRTEDIVARLMEKYDVDEDRAKQAVDTVMIKLTKHGII